MYRSRWYAAVGGSPRAGSLSKQLRREAWNVTGKRILERLDTFNRGSSRRPRARSSLILYLGRLCTRSIYR